MLLPDTTCNWVSFIIPLGLAAFTYTIAGLLLVKYWLKKTGILKALALMVFFLACAVFSDPLFYYLDLGYSLNSTFPFMFSAVANIFLVFFVMPVFFKDARFGWLHFLAMLEVLVAVLTPLIPVLGIFDGDTLPVLLIHVTVSAIVYMTLFTRAFRVRGLHPRVDVIGEAGMAFIGLSGIFLLAALVSFVMHEIPKIVPEFGDALASVGFREGSCTYFVVIGWILASISGMFIYMGYVMPGWLRKVLR